MNGQLALDIERRAHDGTHDGPGYAVATEEPDPKRVGKIGFKGDRTLPAFRIGYRLGGGYVGRFANIEQAKAFEFHRRNTGVTIRPTIGATPTR